MPVHADHHEDRREPDDVQPDDVFFGFCLEFHFSSGFVIAGSPSSVSVRKPCAKVMDSLFPGGQFSVKIVTGGQESSLRSRNCRKKLVPSLDNIDIREMASKNTSTNSRQAVQRSNSDSARWIAGLLLLFIGLFAAAAVFFSFFSWAADQSGLQKSVEERVTLGIEPENLCGWAGARLGRLLVDNSFGLFGLLIPVMIVLVGVRIIRQRPLLMNHSILSLFLIMILGSLTLGFAFAGRWSLCCSTGWGGAFGIASSALLRTHIGAFGTLILLVGGWILTGVFINRNFINKVNEAGNVVVDKSGKVVEILKHKVVPHVRAAGEDEAAEPAAEPAPKPGPKAAAPQSAGPKAAGTCGAEGRSDPCGAPGGGRCGPEIRGGRRRKSLPRTDARRKTRRPGRLPRSRRPLPPRTGSSSRWTFRAPRAAW